MLKKIKTLREKCGISQKTLGDIIGMSQQSINSYENSDIEPDVATFIALADYFGTSVDYIMEHHVEMSDILLDKQEIEHVKNYRKLNDNSQRIIDEIIVEMLHKP